MEMLGFRDHFFRVNLDFFKSVSAVTDKGNRAYFSKIPFSNYLNSNFSIFDEIFLYARSVFIDSDGADIL